MLRLAARVNIYNKRLIVFVFDFFIPLFLIVEDHDSEEGDQERDGDKGGDQHGFDLDSLRDDADIMLFFGLDAVAADEHTVGVDTVGGTGNEGAVVFIVGDLEVGDFLGEDDMYLVDLVSKLLIEDIKDKLIALDEAVELCKELGAGEAAVAGDYGVGRRAADGERGPFEVAGGDLQDAFGGAVVQGEGDIDERYLDIAHDTVAADIEQLVILLRLLSGGDIGIGAGEDIAVIFLGGGDKPRVLFFAHARDGLGI